jgi:hypothetical protein
MARHYAKAAYLTKNMRGVAKKFEREANRRRTKASNLAPKGSNLDHTPKKRDKKEGQYQNAAADQRRQLDQS